MKRRYIVIAIVAAPFLLLMLLGGCFFFYASYKDSSSKAFDKKTVFPAEFKDFHIEEMIVQGSDTLFLFGSYGILTQQPAVLGTYDGGISWKKNFIRDSTFIAQFNFTDDHMFLTSYEKDSNVDVVYASSADYLTWDSIGSYKCGDYWKVHIVRVNDTVPEEPPKYKVEYGRRVHPSDFVNQGLPIFARNDKNWIIGSSGNQVLFYQIENGKALLQHKMSYGNKGAHNLWLLDFLVRDNVFAAIVSDGLWFSDNFSLLYSTDGGHTWKQERVSADASIYRLDIREKKIFLAYYHVGRESVSILTLSIE